MSSEDDGPHSFQMTPLGIMPIGAALPDASATAPAVIPQGPPAIALMRAQEMLRENGVSGPIVTRVPGQEKPITGKSLLAMARTRLRELDKMCPALERERTELRRLVDAASPKKARKGIQ